MVIFMSTWLAMGHGCPLVGSNTNLVVDVKVIFRCKEHLNLPSCGWASSDQFKALGEKLRTSKKGKIPPPDGNLEIPFAFPAF